MNEVENKRNKLNSEIRCLLSLIEIIDGKKGEYINYKNEGISEFDFLDQQILLINDARNRLTDIFKN